MTQPGCDRVAAVRSRASIRLGYLVQLAPDQPSVDGPSGPEEDFTDLHAWAEVYIPAPVGSGSIPPRHCLPVRAIFRWLPRLIRHPRPRSPGQPSRR